MRGKCILTPSQVMILKTLADAADGLTRAQIETATGVASVATAVGAPTGNTTPDSLLGLRMIRARRDDVNGRDVISYTITARGHKAADATHYSRPVSNGNRVPGDVLDQVIRRIMPSRTYGLETYTEEDMEEVRQALPEEYHHVPLPDLQRQIVTRRKTGAFAKPFAYPQWYQAYRGSKKWKERALQALQATGYSCTICSAIVTVSDVYHRLPDRIGDEAPGDLIPLCPACHKRNVKHMPAIPAEQPW